MGFECMATCLGATQPYSALGGECRWEDLGQAGQLPALGVRPAPTAMWDLSEEKGGSCGANKGALRR